MKNETHKLYNGEVELMFDPVAHLYTVNGKRVTGVTGATSTIAKPALIFWASNMAVSYISKSIKAGLRYDEIQLKEIFENAKRAHTTFKESAASKGKMVHEWIEEFIKGRNPRPPMNEELRNATEAFVKWTKENKVIFRLSEQKAYSKLWNYAGTLDFTAEVNGKLVLGDVKTSSGIYPEMFYQVAAYQLAREEEYPDEDYKSNLIVRCGKDGSLEIQESREFEENSRAFLGALAIYNRQQELKDREIQKLLEVK